MNVFAGKWLSEWSVNGMNVIVLHRLKTVLSYYEAYILGQECVKDERERDKRERTGIKSLFGRLLSTSVCLV